MSDSTPISDVRRTPRFDRWVRKSKLEREVAAATATLVIDPTAGDVVPGTSGIRKVRMAGAGRGKRGGFRVMYSVLLESTVLLLLDGFSKSEKEDLADDELARLIDEVKRTTADIRAERAAAEEPRTED